MSKNQQLIEYILSTSERARRDDKFLQLKVWKAQGLPVEGDFAVRYLSQDISGGDAITRTRRKIQERGDYLPPESVQLKRNQRQKTVRQEIIRTPEPMSLLEGIDDF